MLKEVDANGNTAKPARRRKSAEEATDCCCEQQGWQAACQGSQENDGRVSRTDAGEQGKKIPKKAAPEATKGTKAAQKSTRKGKGEGKGKGGGEFRPAPARAAKRKASHIVCKSGVDDDDCDSDYATEYGSQQCFPQEPVYRQSPRKRLIGWNQAAFGGGGDA